MNNLCVLQVLLISVILFQTTCYSSVDLLLQDFNLTNDHSKLQSIKDKRQIFM